MHMGICTALDVQQIEAYGYATSSVDHKVPRIIQKTNKRLTRQLLHSSQKQLDFAAAPVARPPR